MTTMWDNFGHLVEPKSRTATGDINYPRSQAISAKRTADAVEAIREFLIAGPQPVPEGMPTDKQLNEAFGIPDFDPSTNQRPDGSPAKPRPGAEQRRGATTAQAATDEIPGVKSRAGAEQHPDSGDGSVWMLDHYTDVELYEELDRRSDKRRAETAEREKREAALREESQKRHRAFLRMRKALEDHASHRALFANQPYYQPYYVSVSYDDLKLIVSS